MIDIILGILGTILYPLFSIVFMLIDILQGVFKQLAGIGNINIGTGGNFTDGGTTITGDVVANMGEETGTGLIYYLLNDSVVKNMLISIMVLGIFLLIIFTVMAFIKNVYSSKQKSWKEIIGNSLKGLANFVFIPVCCLLGIWLSNILLIAIDGATSQGGAQLMSRKLFLAAAYNANEFRSGNGDPQEEDYEEFAGYYKKYLGVPIASIELEEGEENTYGGPWEKGVKNVVPTDEEIAALLDSFYGRSDGPQIYAYPASYNLWEINYLTLIVGGVFMLYVLIGLAYGMIRRMFILVILYIISPALCAMYPLDEGKAAGNWKQDFIKNTISAYGGVAGLNIFFSIMPMIDKIQLLETGSFLNDLLQIIIMTSGLFVVKELITMISGYIGADDAFSKGTALRGQTKGALKKYAGGAVKGTVGAFARAKGARDAGGSFAGSLAKDIFAGGGKKLLSGMTGGVVDLNDLTKTAKDSHKTSFDSTIDARKKKYDKNEEADKIGEHGKNATGVNAQVQSIFAGYKGKFADADLNALGYSDYVKPTKGQKLTEDQKKRNKEIEEEYSRRHALANKGLDAGVAMTAKERDMVYEAAGKDNIDAVMKKIASNQNRFADYNDKVYDVDKEKERYAKTQAKERERVSTSAAVTGATTAREKYDKFVEDHGVEEDGVKVFKPTKISAADLEIARLKAEQEIRSGSGQTTAQDEYKKLLEQKDLNDEYTQLQATLNDSLELVADKLAAAAENLKGEDKENTQAIADAIKNAIATGDSNALMSKEIVDAIEKANKTKDKELGKVLDELMKVIKKEKEGGGK